ncbi:MAG: GGDEF domain-containing protein [Candidatus Competibacteraceae bacterium]|nr:GGDEF domain-containing protein [Candidatus Competibacteraceae bacterium]
MRTKLRRLLEKSVQTLASAGASHGAAGMASHGLAAEPAELLRDMEQGAVPAALLAVAGAATQAGLHDWRKLQKTPSADAPKPLSLGIGELSALMIGQDRLIADLRNQVVVLSREKEVLTRLLREKSETMRKDPLTGVYNRLAYEDQLHGEYQRWKRFRNPLTFLIWDIDHFKTINDRHGHAAGDEVLRGVAQQLAGRIRTTDFLARYGGEEFAMLLPGADRTAAFNVADKLRRNIAEATFSHRGVTIPVTISCGLAAFETGDSPESVFERADKALYQAKRAGRNCCWMIA